MTSVAKGVTTLMLPLLLLLVNLPVRNGHAFSSRSSYALSVPSNSAALNAAMLEAPSVAEEEEDDLYNGAEGEASRLVPESQLSTALLEAIAYSTMDAGALSKEGWKLVHDLDMFKLWKRKTKSKLYEYLMVGHVADVSPRDFLAAQLDKKHREVWDTSMSEMEYIDSVARRPNSPPPLLQCRAGASSNTKAKRSAEASPLSKNDQQQQVDSGLEAGDAAAADTLYYRTKWPWPLKDRDYILARRCRQYDEQQALVFVSRSTQLDTPRPAAKGTLRVENYWCHSTFLALSSSSSSSSSVRQPQPPKFEGAADKGGGGRWNGVSKQPLAAVKRLGNVRLPFQSPPHELSVGGAATAANGLDLPGTTFVTRFCDDSKVPLPTSIVEKIAKVAEAQVPPSMQRLYECARRLPAAASSIQD
jgi:hypothetical protein